MNIVNSFIPVQSGFTSLFTNLFGGLSKITEDIFNVVGGLFDTISLYWDYFINMLDTGITYFTTVNSSLVLPSLLVPLVPSFIGTMVVFVFAIGIVKAVLSIL